MYCDTYLIYMTFKVCTINTDNALLEKIQADSMNYLSCAKFAEQVFSLAYKLWSEVII